MKHSDAAKMIRQCLWLCQKTKSDMREVLSRINDDTETQERVLLELFEWLFDEGKNILTPLLILDDRLQIGGQISPMEFYNIMFIFERKLKPIKEIYPVIYNGERLPDPDIKLVVAGWEGEINE